MEKVDHIEKMDEIFKNLMDIYHKKKKDYIFC